jgi:hypothetical protein
MGQVARGGKEQLLCCSVVHNPIYTKFVVFPMNVERLCSISCPTESVVKYAKEEFNQIHQYSLSPVSPVSFLLHLELGTTKARRFVYIPCQGKERKGRLFYGRRSLCRFARLFANGIRSWKLKKAG